MTKRGRACGKIILSGEYAVAVEGRGIAVPSSLGMDLTFQPSAQALKIAWDALQGDTRWNAYATHIADLCGCVTGTLHIKNDLPLGKGMGSSTSLVVAMARCLIGEDEPRAKEIEDIVNPGNSGMDVAVIWKEHPILFQKGNSQSVTIDLSFLSDATLVDTGSPDQRTPELVAWMNERQEKLRGPLSTIDGCTERLMNGESPLSVFPDHHRAQVALGVVSPSVDAYIRRIEEAGGAAKVIGAGGRTGGGGIVLAIGLPRKIAIQLASEAGFRALH